MPEPLRTCVGCRRRAPQREMIRLTRGWDGQIQVGRSLPGRGAWLCNPPAGCFDAALRRKAFARAFRAPVDGDRLTALRATLATPAGGAEPVASRDAGKI